MHSVTILMNCICIIFTIPATACEPEAVEMLRAASGRDARLPCGPKDPFLDGTAKNVVWLKGNSYLYRFPPLNAEIRRGSRDQLLGPICDSTFCPYDSGLLIKKVSDRDAGLYCCRIHYHSTPSAEHYYNLTVVEPTGIPRIFNENGDQVILGFLGPYSIGADVSFLCVVNTEGSSATELYWLRNGEMLQNVPIRRSGAMEIHMHLTNITRAELNVRYECVTQNADVSEPLVTSAIIKMYLAPLSLEIRLDDNYNFEAGQPRVVDCVVVGCVPPPIITWHLANAKLRPHVHKELHDGNYTVSSLTLTPSLRHNGTDLVCKAYNRFMPDVDYETKVTLFVGFRPICKTNTETIGAVIHEPENVTCIVDAAPEPVKFLWTFPDSNRVYSTFAPQPLQKLDGFQNRYKATLTWTFRRDDLGMVNCRAINAWGEQKQGCIFNISYGGVPEVPDCDVRRTYPNSLWVRCIKGWDGGRPQIIHLEIVNEDGSCIKNLTNKNGIFFLPELLVTSNLSAVIYASNKRGKSKERTTYLQTLIPLVDAKTSFFPVSWLPYIEAFGTLIALVSTAGIVVLCLKILSARRRELTERSPDIVQISEGAFHREPDFIRDERLLNSTNITVNQLASCQNQYSPPPLPLQPACRVLVDNSSHSSPGTSYQQSYFV